MKLADIAQHPQYAEAIRQPVVSWIPTILRAAAGLAVGAVALAVAQPGAGYLGYIIGSGLLIWAYIFSPHREPKRVAVEIVRVGHERGDRTAAWIVDLQGRERRIYAEGFTGEFLEPGDIGVAWMQGRRMRHFNKLLT